MKPLKKFFTLNILILHSSLAFANGFDDFDAAALAACEQMKVCVDQDPQSQTPEMKPIMDQIVGTMCQQFKVSKDIAIASGLGPNHPVIKTGTSCLRRIAAQPCGSREEEIPECVEAGKISDKYSDQIKTPY